MKGERFCCFGKGFSAIDGVTSWGRWPQGFQQRERWWAPSSTECTSMAEHHFNPLREMLVTVFHTHQRAEELLWRCGGTELAPVLVPAALRPEMWDSGWAPEKMRLCDQSGGTADYHSHVWASATFVK